MTTSEMATVLAWHDALNAGDLDTLLTLSSDDIEIGDAAGAAQGHAALREWAQALDVKAEPGRIYVNDGGRRRRTADHLRHRGGRRNGGLGVSGGP